MKQLNWFLSMAVLVAAPVMAADSEMTRIENANLVCSAGPGGGISINTKDKRVWMTDEGSDEGLELSVSDFQTMRCPNCYLIKASLSLLGQSADATLKVDGVTGSFNEANLVFTMEQDGESTSLDMKCQVKRN